MPSSSGGVSLAAANTWTAQQTFEGGIKLHNSDIAYFGSSNGFLVFNDGYSTHLNHISSGQLYLNGNSMHFQDIANNYFIRMLDQGTGPGVSLYHNNSAKLTTATTGIAITGDLTTTGDITATGDVTAYSDIKFKTNIEKIPNAIEKVKQLNGYTFDRTDIETKRQTGVIAQEVLEVLPEAVVSNNGDLSVAYGNMVGLLIEAIKDLKDEIEELKRIK